MQIQEKRSDGPLPVAGLSNNIQPIIIVYQRDDNSWRAFAHPYGESTEADTKDEALTQIRDLTEAYKEIAAQYKNPTHLIHGGLGDITDREVFAWVFGNKDMLKQLHSSAGKADSEYCYVESYRDQSK
ncbi:hypothetical protein FJY93_03075 [Candidatus Kaiserbacteria bacterium]|nr:hypothetical protein [Candidatus Kaiserbacteria bacterium]